jgi:hypothetical protein
MLSVPWASSHAQPVQLLVAQAGAHPGTKITPLTISHLALQLAQHKQKMRT